MHRESLPSPSIQSCIQRIPADDWPQRMSVVGRFAVLILLPALLLVMFGGMIWLVLLVLGLGLQAHRAPLWLIVGGFPFILLILVWQSAEIYREVATVVYRRAVGAIERSVAIFFAGPVEAFGASQQTVALFYGALCLALIPCASLLAYAFESFAPFALLQSVFDGTVQWEKVPMGTAVQALIYVVAILVLFVLSSALSVSKKFRSVITRPKLMPHVARAPVDVSCQTSFRIAHVSDLHVMADGQVLAEDPERRLSIDAVAEVFSLLSREPDVNAIVISGDLTDKGDVDSWKALLSCSGLSDITERIVIAPGNHDLNPIEPGLLKSIINLADLRRTGQNLRALRYLQAANALMGRRATIICPYTHRLATLSQVMERAQGDVAVWTARTSNKDRVRKRALLPRDLLEKCFPMLVAVEGGCADMTPSFLVWNSVGGTGWPLLNAVGDIDDAQIKRAATLVGASSAGALIHVMHHQLAQPNPKSLVSPNKRSPSDRLTSGWTLLLRATGVIDWIESLGQRTVILHGHKHKYFVADLQDGHATIVSAPSGSLGCEESFVEGFDQSKVGHWLDIGVSVDGPHVWVREVDARSVGGAHDARGAKPLGAEAPPR